MAEKAIERGVRIAGQRFTLRSTEVRRVLRHVDPEPIATHYVVVGRYRFPPKQVISAVTGIDRADFTTHQARRTLVRLGFTVGRRGRPSAAPPRPTATRTSAAREQAESTYWLPYVGQWVALRDDEVLHAADSPKDLVGWLNAHDQCADSMFRVPEAELAATGLAPL